jgi:hypothetical protein
VQAVATFTTHYAALNFANRRGLDRPALRGAPPGFTACDAPSARKPLARSASEGGAGQRAEGCRLTIVRHQVREVYEGVIQHPPQLLHPVGDLAAGGGPAQCGQSGCGVQCSKGRGSAGAARHPRLCMGRFRVRACPPLGGTAERMRAGRIEGQAAALQGARRPPRQVLRLPISCVCTLAGPT